MTEAGLLWLKKNIGAIMWRTSKSEHHEVQRNQRELAKGYNLSTQRTAFGYRYMPRQANNLNLLRTALYVDGN
jgi:hypothetical protein